MTAHTPVQLFIMYFAAMFQKAQGGKDYLRQTSF